VQGNRAPWRARCRSRGGWPPRKERHRATREKSAPLAVELEVGLTSVDSGLVAPRPRARSQHPKRHPALDGQAGARVLGQVEAEHAGDEAGSHARRLDRPIGCRFVVDTGKILLVRRQGCAAREGEKTREASIGAERPNRILGELDLRRCVSGQSHRRQQGGETRVAHSNGIAAGALVSESLTIGSPFRGASGREVGLERQFTISWAYVITIQNCRAPTSPDPS